MDAYPSFSWSWSRAELLSACARAYYHRYYSSHRGYSRAAPQTARRSYALKHLTTLEQTLGQAVHDCAATCARACRDGLPLPPMEAMRERVRSTLNCVSLSRDRVAFLEAPKRRRMLTPVYYHGELSPEAVARTRARMDACLQNVAESPLWQELRAADPATIIIPEEPACVEIDGIMTYLVPDLVFYGEGWIIVDWKTGRLRDTRMQACVYGLFIEHVLGEQAPCTARVQNLLLACEERHDIGADDLREAREFIQQSVACMHSLLRDVEQNAPKDVEHFPTARNPSRCSSCNFLELCAKELGFD